MPSFFSPLTSALSMMIHQLPIHAKSSCIFSILPSRVISNGIVVCFSSPSFDQGITYGAHLKFSSLKCASARVAFLHGIGDAVRCLLNALNYNLRLDRRPNVAGSVHRPLRTNRDECLPSPNFGDSESDRTPQYCL